MNRDDGRRLTVLNGTPPAHSPAFDLLRSEGTATRHVKNTLPASDVKGSEHSAECLVDRVWDCESWLKAPSVKRRK